MPNRFTPKPLPRWTGKLFPGYGCDNSAGIIVRCDRRVSQRIAAAVRTCASGLMIVSPAEHWLTCVVLPQVNVLTPDNHPAQGFFYFPDWHPSKVTRASLAVCAGLGTIRHVLQILGHEYAHYEQWRDGHGYTERGVEVRGRNLVKMAMEVGS